MKHMNGYDPDKPATKTVEISRLLAIAGTTFFLIGVATFLVEWRMLGVHSWGWLMLGIVGAFMLVPWYVKEGRGERVGNRSIYDSQPWRAGLGAVVIIAVTWGPLLAVAGVLWWIFK